MKNASTFLREEAAELATGGGAAAPALAVLPDPEPAAAAPAAPAAVEEPAREPSLLEKARAAFQSKATILAEANDAQRELAEAQRLITTLQTEKAGLAAQVDGLTAELEKLRTERAELAQLIDSAKTEKAAAEEKAADLVAAIGFPAAALPAAETEPEDDLDALQAKLGKATDPKERWDLSRKISALRWK